MAAFFGTAPARADSFGLSIGPGGGFSFSLDTGGYCDQWGCPDEYWDYPIFYGPVYYGGYWYRGPVYYRMIRGERYYWVRGGWHRDGWRGTRPSWAGRVHYGPALGLDYYRSNGFRVRDNDWRRYEVRHRDYRRDHQDNNWRGDNRRYDNNRYDNNRYDRSRDNTSRDRHNDDRNRYQQRSRENGWDQIRGGNSNAYRAPSPGRVQSTAQPRNLQPSVNDRASQRDNSSARDNRGHGGGDRHGDRGNRHDRSRGN
jgi:hypothetical protein